MGRLHAAGMDQAPDIPDPQPADPYGEVALGVECAWPSAEIAILTEPHPES